MSLGPTFVLAVNNFWYEDPVFELPGKWFVCFDETDPPELVMATDTDPHGPYSAEPVTALIDIAVSVFGKAVNLRGDYRFSGRCFQIHRPGKRVRLDMKSAASVFLKLPGRIPVPHRFASRLPMKSDSTNHPADPCPQGTFIDYARSKPH